MITAFIDLETTGLNENVHGVWQIGAIFDVDGTEVDSLNLEVAPMEGQKVSKEVLEKGPVTMEHLRSLPPAAEIFPKVQEKFKQFVNPFKKNKGTHDKMFWVGYNSEFDIKFLRKWWENCGDNYFGSWFWWPDIDMMRLAAMHCRERRASLSNFKLETVYKHLTGKEVDQDKTHDALYDVELTREIFYLLDREK